MSDDPIVRFVDSTVKDIALGRKARKAKPAKKDSDDKADNFAPLWHYRLELATILIPVGLYLAFGTAALVVIAATATGLGVVYWSVPGWLPRLYRHHVVRRQVHRALEDTGALTAHRNDRKPLQVKIMRVRDTNVGERLSLRLKGGGSLQDLESRASQITANLSTYRRPVKEVRFERNRRDGGRPHMIIDRFDPFDNADSTLWPLLAAQETSVWDPLPLAHIDSGQPLTLSTMGEGHVLIGGVTRSGKSVCLNLFVAQAALDPLAHLIGFDNQEAELTPWKPVLGTFVGGNMNDAINALKAVQAIGERLSREMAADGRKKVKRGDVTHNVFIDELAYYLMHKQHGQDFERLLLDILQRFAKCGIRVVACTQRPAGSIVGTDLRAQFTHRLAFRTKEAETTQMILGSRNAPAHEIPNHQKGVFYFETDTDAAVRARSHLLTEEHVGIIVQRATDRIKRSLVKELDNLTNPPPTPPTPKVTEQRARSASATLTEELLGTLPGEAKSTPQLVGESGLDRAEVSTVLGGLLKAKVVDRRLEFPDRKPSKTNPWLYWVVRGGDARNVRGTGDPLD